jgi:hypothetical protein
MTRKLQNSGALRIVLRIGLILSVLAVPERQQIEAFGGAGPYNHLEITRLALDRYAAESGVELTTACQELIMQGSVVSDSLQYAHLDMFHCDNNNIPGCSYKLDELTREAEQSVFFPTTMNKIGQSLHIIQDFYSHSNWVEINGFNFFLAPIEVFKDIPPPVQVQTGVFPDVLVGNLQLQFNCYLNPQSTWTDYIPGATHGCLNKDSGLTPRGASYVPGGFGMTYHDLAAEYAIRHTVEYMKRLEGRSLGLQMCLVPRAATFGCNSAVVKLLH